MWLKAHVISYDLQEPYGQPTTVHDVPPVSLFDALDGGISDDCATVVAHLTEKVEDAEMHQKLQDDLKYHLYNVYKTGKHEDAI